MKVKIIIAIVFLLAFFENNKILAVSHLSHLNDMGTTQQPKSIHYKNRLSASPTIIVNAIDYKAVKKQDIERQASNLPYRFALPVEGYDDFNKQGRWEVQGDTSIWRLTVTSEQATSFNIGLTNLFLPQNAKLYFYTRDYQSIAGPYTDKDNKAHKQLWSPILESNEVTIEINIPTKFRSFLTFKVAEISQGYRSAQFETQAKSGSCNNDVVCSESDAWRNEIRSVARYTINIDGGTFLCSGTLMNNVKGDYKPLFLTAGHCGVSSVSSPSIVLYWNYETSICSGDPDGQLNQFQSGTIFLAGTDPTDVGESDFALVELDSIPDASFNVFYSGWDKSDLIPSSSVGIHHPSGDEKRISFDNDPLSITNYTSHIVTDNGTHFKVSAWDDGTTEGGSSGSGLWNSDHRLVATLSGGFASCDAPSEPDWYGRLASHWEGDGTSVGQVKTWLDPDETNAMTLDGVNSCVGAAVNIISAPETASLGESLSFVANATGGVAPYSFSWDFNSDSVIDQTTSSAEYVFNHLYQGNIRLTVTDATGCPSIGTTAIVVTNSGNELFPNSDDIPSDLVVSSGADAGWSVDSIVKFEGASSIKSDTISDEQVASIEVVKEFSNPEGNFIGFVYKVSSEAGFDLLVFSIDGEVKATWSGEVDWTTVSYPLTAGAHTLKWSYEKDESVSSGNDTAWIDGITGVLFSSTSNNSPPVAQVSSSNITVNELTQVVLNASGSNDPDGDPLTYSWSQTGGSPMVSLSNSNTARAIFNAPEVSTETQLTFMVTVTDSEGAASGAEVTVVVQNVVAEENESGGGGVIGLFWLSLFLLSRQRKLK